MIGIEKAGKRPKLCRSVTYGPGNLLLYCLLKVYDN